MDALRGAELMAWNGFSGPAAPPLPAPPSDFGDRFTSDYQATVAADLGAGSRNRLTSEAYQEAIDRVFSVTGRKVDNPAWVMKGLLSDSHEASVEARAAADDQLRQAWGQAREKDPTIGDFPDIEKRAVELGQRYQTVAAARQATSGVAAAVGGFLGGTAGQMEHPVQMLTMPYGGFFAKGGTVATRILKEAVENAAIGAATQLPVELGAAEWRTKLGIEFNIGQNVLNAAAGGAIFGAGAKALGEAGSALLGRAQAPASVSSRPWWPVAEAHARQWGVNPGYVGILGAIESGGENIATQIKDVRGQPASSATGPFQFVSGTWSALAQKYPNLGLEPGNRTDPLYQAKAIAALTADNQNTLRQTLGRDPTWTELYGAHVFGSGPAGKIAEASPNSPLVDVVGRKAIEANPQWNGWTVGQWKAKYDEAFGRSHLIAPEPDVPQPIKDAVRMVERRELDASQAIGGIENSKLHRENVMAAERAIVDGPDVPVTPLAPQAVSEPVRAPLESPAPTTQTQATVAVTEPAAAPVSANLEQVKTADVPPPVPEAVPVREVLPADVSTRIDDLQQAVAAGRALPQMDTTPDLRDAAALMQRLDSEGVSLADHLGAGSLDRIPPKAMVWLHAMHDDFGLKVRSSPEKISQRVADYVDEAMKLRPGQDAPAPSSGEQPLARIEMAVERDNALRDTPVEVAADALAGEARRQVADALTSRPTSDQKIDIGDGREIALSDLDSEFNRLDREVEGADIISNACITLKPKANA